MAGLDENPGDINPEDTIDYHIDEKGREFFINGAGMKTYVVGGSFSDFGSAYLRRIVRDPKNEGLIQVTPLGNFIIHEGQAWTVDEQGNIIISEES